MEVVLSTELYKPTYAEHVANIGTHALCIVPAVCAACHLIAAAGGTAANRVFCIYGCALPALFLTSTSYHLVHMLLECEHSRARRCLHWADRAVIFVFIAASYTPWLELKLPHRAHAAAGITAVVWLLALAGTAWSFAFRDKYPIVDMCLYVAAGALPAPLIVVLTHDTSGLCLMAGGGCVYMAGLLFYHVEGRLPYAHAVWHVHVAAAAAMHYAAVLGTLVEHDVEARQRAAADTAETVAALRAVVEL